MKNILIDLIIKDRNWVNNVGITNSSQQEGVFRDYKNILEDVVAKTLFVLKIKLPKNSVIEFSVVLTNNKEIQALNKQYRNKDKPTNVLSFQVIKNRLDKEILQQSHLLLGDIFISLDMLRQEAKEQGKSIQNHFIHLFLHSFLHLLGYDHIKEKEAEKMEGLEVEVLKEMGIRNPYR